MVKNLPAMWETWVWPWVGKILWRRNWQPIPVFLPGEFHGQRSLSMGSQRVRHDQATHIHTQIHRHIHTCCLGWTLDLESHSYTKFGLHPSCLQGLYLCSFKTEKNPGSQQKRQQWLMGRGSHVWSKSWSDAPLYLRWYDSSLLSWLGRGDRQL